MGLILDLILILTFVFTVIFYTHKGFIKSCFGLCKYIIAFGVAYLFAPQLSQIFFDTFMYDNVNASVYKWMSDILFNSDGQLNIQDFVNQIPQFISNLLKSIGVSLSSFVADNGNDIINEELLTSISSSVSASIAEFLSDAVAYVSIFLLSVIILTISVFILDKICKLPVLKQLNKTLGFIFGIICAMINTMAVCAIITIILNIVGVKNPDLIPEIICKKTVIYDFINHINIFSWLS